MFCAGNIVAVAGVTEAFDPKTEGENYTRTLMRFSNGATATLEMGGVPGARYGPEPWCVRQSAQSKLNPSLKLATERERERERERENPRLLSIRFAVSI
jgi:hypothetical protein